MVASRSATTSGGSSPPNHRCRRAANCRGDRGSSRPNQKSRTSWARGVEVPGGVGGVTPAGSASLAETLEHALGHGRQALAGQFPCLRGIHDVLKRPGHHHAAHRRMLGGQSCHLVQHGETAVDLVAGSGPALYRAGQVLAESAVQEIVVIADLKPGFGEKIGKILLKILSDTQQTGAGIRRGRSFARLHRSGSSTSKGPDNHFWASRAVPHPATRADNKTYGPAMQ